MEFERNSLIFRENLKFRFLLQWDPPSHFHPGMLFQQNDPRNEEISMSTYPEHKILSHSDRYEQSYGQTADPTFFS